MYEESDPDKLLSVRFLVTQDWRLSLMSIGRHFPPLLAMQLTIKILLIGWAIIVAIVLLGVGFGTLGNLMYFVVAAIVFSGQLIWIGLETFGLVRSRVSVPDLVRLVLSIGALIWSAFLPFWGFGRVKDVQIDVAVLNERQEPIADVNVEVVERDTDKTYVGVTNSAGIATIRAKMECHTQESLLHRSTRMMADAYVIRVDLNGKQLKANLSDACARRAGAAIAAEIKVIGK